MLDHRPQETIDTDPFPPSWHLTMRFHYDLNARADRLCQSLVQEANALRIQLSASAGSARRFDFGVEVTGGLEAGRRMAEICMAGLAHIDIVDGSHGTWPGPAVTVRTDHPMAACMAAQYAGWQVSSDDFFAMGSGPMRAAAGREPLFDSIGLRERPEVAVGLLETRRFPPVSVCAELASACGVTLENLTLLVAPTASLAGCVQVVARSLETALHKMLELGFDLQRVVSGFGVAPLPPVAHDDLAAIGRTNDAVLYGAHVTLWTRGDDESLDQIVEKIPSSASEDHGQPFAEIFARYERDFYKIDPHLFSPAQITLVSLDSGRVFRAGETRPDLLRESFEG